MERIKDLISNIWACIWILGSNVWNLFKGVGQRINSMCVGDKVCSLAVIFILVMSYFYIQDKQVKQAAELAEAQQKSADSLTREERLNVRMNVLVLGVCDCWWFIINWHIRTIFASTNEVDKYCG